MGDVERKLKHTIEKQIKNYSIVVCIAAVFMTAVCTLFFVQKEDKKSNLYSYRLMYANAVEAAEQQDYDQLQNYACYIADNQGQIIFSNQVEFAIGEQINLHSLSTQNEETQVSEYICPLLRDGQQFGTIVIRCPQREVTITSIEILLIVIMGLLLLVIFLCILRILAITKKKLISPIQMMINSVNQGLRGNYQSKIMYYESDEIGQLARQLELLTDELKNSIEHAELLDENEKMLLACVSHDLKTPIATIMGCAEGLGSGLVKEEEKIKRYSDIILTKTKLLTHLIDDILEFTDAKVDQLLMVPKEVYAKEYFTEALNGLMADVMRKGILMEWNEIPNVLLNIAPNRIFQVLQNIVGNSIKYTKEGGRIVITFEENQKFLSVSIRDNGQGIAATDLPYVFDRFYRGEKARTQKETTGSGLGLSIVKSIVERHGGRVECDSILGQETTVTFYLPLI